MAGVTCAASDKSLARWMSSLRPLTESRYSGIITARGTASGSPYGKILREQISQLYRMTIWHFVTWELDWTMSNINFRQIWFDVIESPEI
jgi:hypothetical protein